MTAAPLGLVVLGGSWGGLDAACELLEALPVGFPVPVLLVLHRSRDSCGERLSAVVRRFSGHDLRELDDKDPLEPGKILLAPPDYHVLVEDGAVALSLEAPVGFSRPSIDLALESAADFYGQAVAGVVLSGAGRDGAEGLRRVRARGGRTLVQDPRTAEKADMPEAAVATGAVDLVAAPSALAAHLAALPREPRAGG